MKKEGIYKGNWQSGKHAINMSLPIILFEEEDTKIMYCPALEVYGYGDNQKEAEESFEISLSEYFGYTLNKKTFFEEMKRLGWQVKSKHKKITPPQMTDLLKNNENFNNIFNNYNFTKIDKNLSIPAFA